jgi:LPXTG-motif cell wall-anchored protein
VAPTTTEKPTTTERPTTTVAPTTTERPTTTEKPTTTEEPTTTLAPSTTTTVAAAPVGQLPRTGGGGHGVLVAAGVTLLIAGAALVASAKIGEQRLA